MKRLAILTAFAVVAGMGAVNADAALKLVPAGNDLQADISSFPPDMKERYALYKVKCAKCHKLERSLKSIQSGVTPSMVPFDDKAINAYGAKMVRKAGSNMSQEEVNAVTKLLRYMRTEAGQ